MTPTLILAFAVLYHADKPTPDIGLSMSAENRGVPGEFLIDLKYEFYHSKEFSRSGIGIIVTVTDLEKNAVAYGPEQACSWGGGEDGFRRRQGMYSRGNAKPGTYRVEAALVTDAKGPGPWKVMATTSNVYVVK
jgi:hypothetical protein